MYKVKGVKEISILNYITDMDVSHDVAVHRLNTRQLMKKIKNVNPKQRPYEDCVTSITDILFEIVKTMEK